MPNIQQQHPAWAELWFCVTTGRLLLNRSNSGNVVCNTWNQACTNHGMSGAIQNMHHHVLYTRYRSMEHQNKCHHMYLRESIHSYKKHTWDAHMKNVQPYFSALTVAAQQTWLTKTYSRKCQFSAWYFDIHQHQTTAEEFYTLLGVFFPPPEASKIPPVHKWGVLVWMPARAFTYSSSCMAISHPHKIR